MNFHIREVLECMSKEQVVDLIIQYGENDYYMMALFLLNSEFPFSVEELQGIWNGVYETAVILDRKDDSRGADLLADCAELYFTHIKRQREEKLQLELAQKLVNDLTRACVEDGIGMRSDSEWLYTEVANRIAKHYDGKLELPDGI